MANDDLRLCKNCGGDAIVASNPFSYWVECTECMCATASHDDKPRAVCEWNDNN